MIHTFDVGFRMSEHIRNPKPKIRNILRGWIRRLVKNKNPFISKRVYNF